MKKLLLLLSVLIIVSCSKTQDTPKRFEINSINTSSSKIIFGQRNVFKAILSDSTGNINYEWKLFYNNLQVGTTLSGLNIKSVQINTPNIGEFTLTLTITRGASDKSTFEKKFISYESNFQYGVWGDSETTIKTAESDNGNDVFNALVGIPEITTNNLGLTTLIFSKSGKYYTYYFKAGKLFAGAYTQTWNYVNQNTDLRQAYTIYYTEKTHLESVLNIILPDGKIWRTPDNSTQIVHWDESTLTRSQAIGLDYLELKTEGTSALGKGSINLHKHSFSSILFEFILISPN